MGQDQVDAGGGDALQRADGAGELAFQGALAVEVLDEIGLAERRRRVEDLVAHRAGGRQALARQHQAGGGDLVAGHQDGRAVALDLVLDPALVESLGDGPGLLEVEIGIEQGAGLVAEIVDDGEQGEGHARRSAKDGDHAAKSESCDQTCEWIHAAAPGPGSGIIPRR